MPVNDQDFVGVFAGLADDFADRAFFIFGGDDDGRLHRAGIVARPVKNCQKRGLNLKKALRSS
jgi:hypothetical protein